MTFSCMSCQVLFRRRTEKLPSSLNGYVTLEFPNSQLSGKCILNFSHILTQLFRNRHMYVLVHPASFFKDMISDS